LHHERNAWLCGERIESQPLCHGVVTRPASRACAGFPRTPRTHPAQRSTTRLVRALRLRRHRARVANLQHHEQQKGKEEEGTAAERQVDRARSRARPVPAASALTLQQRRHTRPKRLTFDILQTTTTSSSSPLPPPPLHDLLPLARDSRRQKQVYKLTIPSYPSRAK
jgi:hypothetical protein